MGEARRRKAEIEQLKEKSKFLNEFKNMENFIEGLRAKDDDKMLLSFRKFSPVDKRLVIDYLEKFINNKETKLFTGLDVG